MAAEWCLSLSGFFCILLTSRFVEGPPVIVKEELDQSIDLNSGGNACSSKWTFSGAEVEMPMEVTVNSSGAYKCKDASGNVVLLLAVDVTSLDSMPTPAVVGENLTLMCYGSLWPPEPSSSGITVTNSLRITDSEGVELKDQEVNVDIREGSGKLEMTSVYEYFQVVEPGDRVYNCTWDYTVQYEGVAYTGRETVGHVLSVYKPVDEPLPDKTKVVVYDLIQCSARGRPEPSYTWRCMDGSWNEGEETWTTHGPTLVLTAPREFECTCTAFNEIPPNVYSKSWEGILRALPRDDSEGQEVDDSDGSGDGVNDRSNTGKNRELEQLRDSDEPDSGAESLRQVASLLVTGLLLLFLVSSGTERYGSEQRRI